MRMLGRGGLGMGQIEIGHVDGEDAVLDGPEVADLALVDLAELAGRRDDQVLEVDLGVLASWGWGNRGRPGGSTIVFAPATVIVSIDSCKVPVCRVKTSPSVPTTLSAPGP